MDSLRKAKQLIGNRFRDAEFSTFISTVPIGMASCNFTNAIAACLTDMATADEVIGVAKAIEKECGNTTALREKGIVALDIDLLSFDGVRYHALDWERQYIKDLIKEMGLEI